jgi:two-component system sensor histidine kinase PilS (NtrC family)
MIGSYFSESLHSAAEQLEEAVEQVADLRKLNEVIVDSIHSGLLTADGAGRILYVNGFGEAILGRRAAEMRGRTIREVFGSWLLDAPGLQARSELARLDVPYTRPDGGALDLGVSVSPLASGARGHLLVFQDLTEITRLEREIRMKEKLAAVGEMASQLAHEIRNPLGSISGSAQVLMAEPNISADQSRLLAIIRRESKRLSDSLSQFLFLTRPAPPPGGPFDLGPVVAEAVTLLRNGSEVRPGHVVDFEKDEGPHTCLAHPDRITQVFWNLVRNGLEAMPDGGRLAIRLSRRGDEVVLSVRDQGRGIAREDQRKVFEPFHSGTAMGTGLGLAIVYRIVREHRGDITIKSAPAQGTEVEVHLPLARALVSA